jgi:hypothetical protein
LGHKAKWEYFRAVYERYHKAGREAKQMMLNEFCLNTGDHWKYAIPPTEWSSSRNAGLGLHLVRFCGRLGPMGTRRGKVERRPGSTPFWRSWSWLPGPR